MLKLAIIIKIAQKHIPMMNFSQAFRFSSVIYSPSQVLLHRQDKSVLQCI
jgi:hypothetical protein